MRVLKWGVLCDDSTQMIGGGPVLLVDDQHGISLGVQVWTQEDSRTAEPTRKVRVFGTGHEIPSGSTHLGSVVTGPFVWHLYEVQ